MTNCHHLAWVAVLYRCSSSILALRTTVFSHSSIGVLKRSHVLVKKNRVKEQLSLHMCCIMCLCVMREPYKCFNPILWSCILVIQSPTARRSISKTFRVVSQYMIAIIVCTCRVYAGPNDFSVLLILLCYNCTILLACYLWPYNCSILVCI